MINNTVMTHELMATYKIQYWSVQIYHGYKYSDTHVGFVLFYNNWTH